jgi:hypothetical protein
MKPIECHLSQRKGNWVVVLPDGKMRPATGTELHIWLKLKALVEKYVGR